MFEEAGLDPNSPPETWDQFMSYGAKLQSGETYAFAESLAQGEQATCAFSRWAKSAGADIYTHQNGKVKWTFSESACVDALSFLKNAMEEGAMDPGSPTYYQQQIADLFGKGHAAMFVNWDMMQIAFKDPEQTPYAGKIKSATMPGKTADLTGSIEGHEYMAVPSASLHKDAAKKFIEYVTSVENVKRRAVQQGMTPIYKELFEDPDVQEKLPLDVIFKSAANCFYRPAVPEYTQCSDVISTEVQNVLVNDKNVKQALTDATNRANDILGW
jgi:multiple sugar transport system substrate-binding protein